VGEPTPDAAEAPGASEPPPIVTSSAAGAAAGAATAEAGAAADTAPPESYGLWGAAPADTTEPAEETPDEVWQTPSPAEYAMPAGEAAAPKPEAGPTATAGGADAEQPATPIDAQSPPDLHAAAEPASAFEPPPTAFEPSPTLGETPPPIPAPPDTDAAAGWGGPLDERPVTERPSADQADAFAEPTPAVAFDTVSETPGTASPERETTDVEMPASVGADSTPLEAPPAPGVSPAADTDEWAPAAAATPIPPVPGGEQAADSEAGPRLVALCDIISTTNTQTVDLNDPDVRRMLRELVQNEVDLAQQYKQLGQNIDAVLQLTEAEKICRTLSMDAHADLLRKMIDELQS